MSVSELCMGCYFMQKVNLTDSVSVSMCAFDYEKHKMEKDFIKRTISACLDSGYNKAFKVVSCPCYIDKNELFKKLYNEKLQKIER